MGHSSPFTIYNASAGSGKTFALVKSYLKKILSHSQPGYYKHLLAITFTNKAVTEMKTRIVDTLVGFSSEKVPEAAQRMLDLIMTETSASEETLKSRAQVILKHLLHHYAQFSVETIDHFNHRLIRTFARDLNLPSNFEVSLDIGELISQAVDQLIDKAGQEPEITKILLEFALQKTEDDKSWDIALDLKKTASLLGNENDAAHLAVLKDKSLSDFMSLRKNMRAKAGSIEKEIALLAEEVITLFAANEIPLEVFSRMTLPNHFLKLTEGNYKVYENKLQQYLEAGGNALYKKDTAEAITVAIDEITPYLLQAYLTIKARVSRLILIQNILKNLVPLASVNLVNQELQLIKENENILPINEFNALIHEQIKDQPAPFIYERLGDRYRDFFIDEFQDTSLLQWNNLIPLIDNALSQSYEGEEPGSLLLVGDAKQSIYRWRGGLPEQFMDLYEAVNPFALSEGKKVENLDTNYRSSQEIVEFNNDFFSFVSGFFGDDGHKNLYEIGNRQKHLGKKGGYVKIEFIDPTSNDAPENSSDPYAVKVHQSIVDVLAQGFRKNDICVLTRKKKEGIAISEYLLENGIPVISEETLLLKNALSVQCLIQILQLSISPQNEEVKIQFLEFLYNHLGIPGEKHTFFQSLIHEPFEVLSEKLKVYSVDFNFNALQSLSLFESCEYSIESLHLETTADAFLTSFMDLVFGFGQRPESGKSAFLDHWETEKERVSISENKSTNAVKVMTIHKSKGLEFPVVLFPYANLDIYKEIEATAWYPFNEAGFDNLLINFNKGVADYGELGAQLFLERRNTLELDNINLLYVALTRAVERLYVFAKEEPLKDIPASYNGFLKAFLQTSGRWDDSVSVYEFGDSQGSTSEKVNANIKSVQIPYVVSSPESHNIKIVFSEVDLDNPENLQSINLGNLLHDTMALVKYSEDIHPVLEDLEFQLRDEPDTFSEIKKMITAIVTHPVLKPLFEAGDRIYNERDIITPERVLRPDRINIHNDESITIIDYKTGVPKEVYEHQISGYAMVLQDMGFGIREKLLVYCNKDAISINKT